MIWKLLMKFQSPIYSLFGKLSLSALWLCVPPPLQSWSNHSDERIHLIHCSKSKVSLSLSPPSRPKKENHSDEMIHLIHCCQSEVSLSLLHQDQLHRSALVHFISLWELSLRNCYMISAHGCCKMEIYFGTLSNTNHPGWVDHLFLLARENQKLSKDEQLLHSNQSNS